MNRKSKEAIISSIAIGYFMIGLIFALFFAYYYHWPALGYFSPGFYSVIVSWPYQALGLVTDILRYGLAGKPLL